MNITVFEVHTMIVISYPQSTIFTEPKTWRILYFKDN